MKIIIECMYTGRRIQIKNVYSVSSDDFAVKVLTEHNGNKEMTYYSGYFIISMEKEGI